MERNAQDLFLGTAYWPTYSAVKQLELTSCSITKGPLPAMAMGMYPSDFF